MAYGPQGTSGLPPYTGARPSYGYPGSPPASFRTDGALSRRLLAYLVDIVVVAVLTGVLWFAIAILGVITLSLGWWLFPLLAVVPVAYGALTMSGRSQGTVGMRMTGLRVIDAQTGGRVDLIRAAVHTLLFYVGVASAFVLLVVDVGVGLLRSDRRLARDLLCGIALVREG